MRSTLALTALIAACHFGIPQPCRAEPPSSLREIAEREAIHGELLETLGYTNNARNRERLAREGIVGLAGLGGPAGAERQRPPRIVIYSPMPYIGDSVLQDFSLFNILESRFQNTPIHYVSPHSGFVNAGGNLSVERLNLDQIIDEELLKVLRSSVKNPTEHPSWEKLFNRIMDSFVPQTQVRGSLIFINDYGFNSAFEQQFLALIRRLPPEERAEYTEQIKKKGPHLLGAILDGLDQQLKKSGCIGILTTGSTSNRIIGAGSSFRSAQANAAVNVLQFRRWQDDLPNYESRHNRHQLLLGQTDSPIFSRPPQGSAGRFLRFAPEATFASFLSHSFTSPGSPYIVINMNTVSLKKLILVGPARERILSEFLEFMRERYPNANILITPPEFPPQANTSILELLERQASKLREIVNSPANVGKVAFLPDGDRALWNNAVAGAAAVVSQDSGFVHLANLIRPPRDTLTYSSNDLARVWRMADQPFVTDLLASGHNPAAMLELKAKLDAMLKRAGVPSASTDDILKSSAREVYQQTPLNRRLAFILYLREQGYHPPWLSLEQRKHIRLFTGDLNYTRIAIDPSQLQKLIRVEKQRRGGIPRSLTQYLLARFKHDSSPENARLLIQAGHIDDQVVMVLSNDLSALSTRNLRDTLQVLFECGIQDPRVEALLNDYLASNSSDPYVKRIVEQTRPTGKSRMSWYQCTITRIKEWIRAARR